MTLHISLQKPQQHHFLAVIYSLSLAFYHTSSNTYVCTEASIDSISNPVCKRAGQFQRSVRVENSKTDYALKANLNISVFRLDLKVLGYLEDQTDRSFRIMATPKEYSI